MSEWKVLLKRDVVEEKVITLSKEEFSSQKEANKYVAEAMQNFSFGEINFPITFNEEVITVEGEYSDYWLEE
tara:strand:- start:130320 stop:130535 length:216 start_codon:yes stop_codon:yes gene_type:complete